MKKPACLAYGVAPRLIPVEAAAAYCSMTIEEFEDFYSGRAIKSRSGKTLYDIRLIDTWLDQRVSMSKGATDPKTLLKGLGVGATKSKTAHVV